MREIRSGDVVNTPIGKQGIVEIREGIVCVRYLEQFMDLYDPSELELIEHYFDE